MNKGSDTKIEELVAKVDFHKTIFQLFFASTLASFIGLFSLYDYEIARTVFFITIPLLGFGSWLCFNFYKKRHEELIESIRKEQ